MISDKENKSTRVDPARVLVIVPNFKRRLSGVMSTIIQLVPLQAKRIGLATLGPGLPEHLPKLKWWQLPRLLRRPQGKKVRVWHARRNVEMIGGLLLRDLFRAPMKIVFTSASQRHHKSFTRFLINRMDAVIATSSKTAGYLKVPNTVVMHGIDVDRFSPPQSRAEASAELGLDPARLYAGCFGRVRHQKGTDVFVDAMIALLPKHPQWSAIVAGRATSQHKEFEDGLKEKVAQAGLSDRILFVGEHTDIDRWYRALSLYVAPQRWEGFGLTPLEAMASGVPVVATDVGAFSELVPGQAGVIVPPGSGDAMIAAVEPYLADDQMRERQGEAARVHVLENFQLSGEANKLIALYEELIASAR